MALSSAESNTISNRFLAIENAINNQNTAINNQPTKAQMISLLNIRQSEIQALQDELATLRAMVEALAL